MYAAYSARLIATLTRFRLSKKEIPRGTSSTEEAASEKNTTGASLPWNLSTVPTRVPLGRSRFSKLTCMLYGATTRMLSRVKACSPPSPSR